MQKLLVIGASGSLGTGVIKDLKSVRLLGLLSIIQV